MTSLSPRVNDLTGKRFGRWTVLEFNSFRRREAVWLCRCDCGTERLVTGSRLTKKNRPTRSCGCGQRKTTHGYSPRAGCARVYKIWCGMLARCHNPNTPNYNHYGGRGICVCDEWNSFENFLRDMGEPPTGTHSLDRVDNSGNYEPGNCRWATRKQQNRNSRHNRLVECNGETKCVSEWAEETEVPYGLLLQRLNNGWDADRAINTPRLSWGNIPADMCPCIKN